MVRIQGRMKYANGKGYAKIDQHFKTKKEADSFLKFLSVGQKGGAEKGTKITEYRKPKRKSSSQGGFFGMGKMRF